VSFGDDSDIFELKSPSAFRLAKLRRKRLQLVPFRTPTANLYNLCVYGYVDFLDSLCIPSACALCVLQNEAAVPALAGVQVSKK
jgi:hypothetical protein